MEKTKPYFDLCISDKCFNTQSFPCIAKRLLEYGYKTIAISRFLNENANEPRKKKKKGDTREQDTVPLPMSFNGVEGSEELKILSRLTIIFSENATIHRVMKSENIKKYDIIAVVPTNQQAFQVSSEPTNPNTTWYYGRLLNQVDADIISFDPEDRNPMRFNRKLYRLATDRGMYFEIMYQPAICDTSFRKNIINRSHLYHTYGKSKNIIITSWATSPMYIRGPYDVMNLGLIFGLSEEQSKTAISTSCKNLLLRAEGRKIGKVAMMVENDDVETMIISSSEDESDMECDLTDQPATKKAKEDK